MSLRSSSMILALLGTRCVPLLSQPSRAPGTLPVVESFFVTPDRVRIYYRVVGSGPQTVLVPFALFHRDRLDALAGPGRRLVTYDPRGRGRSDSVPPGKISLAYNLADLDGLRQALRADSVALIGWSGAGMELFVYALRYPGRVSRLVQLAPVAPRWVPWADSLTASRRARTDSAARARLRADLGAEPFTGREQAFCRAEAQVTTPPTFGDTALARLAPDVCEWRNEWTSRLGPYFEVFMGSLGAFDWRGDLGRVPVPRLVIHGELDNTPLAGNCEWVIGQTNARLLVIPGAGHWPHYERPEQTIAAMRAFLDGRWPEASRTVAVAREVRPCGMTRACC